MAGNTYQPASAATVLSGGTNGDVWIHLHVISDGTQMSNYVFYDNSTLVNNVLRGTLKEVRIGGKITGTVRLNWDQTTPFKICSLNTNTDCHDFTEFGGVHNPGATGATGDITLTSVGLASGDEFHIIARVSQ